MCMTVVCVDEWYPWHYSCLSPRRLCTGMWRGVQLVLMCMTVCVWLLSVLMNDIHGTTVVLDPGDYVRECGTVSNRCSCVWLLSVLTNDIHGTTVVLAPVVNVRECGAVSNWCLCLMISLHCSSTLPFYHRRITCVVWYCSMLQFEHRWFTGNSSLRTENYIFHYCVCYHHHYYILSWTTQRTSVAYCGCLDLLGKLFHLFLKFVINIFFQCTTCFHIVFTVTAVYFI